MKKLRLLFLMLLCMVAGGAWAIDGPDLSAMTWPTPIINEDFSDATVNSSTDKHNPTITNYTALGAFNGIYCNKAGSYGIENSVFGTDNKAMFITPNGSSPIVASITNKTFGTTGAFSFKTKTSCRGYVGLYKVTDANAITHANASVYLYINNTKIQISKGSSWVDVGTYNSNTEIEVTVIYNNTTSSTNYGGDVTLAAKTAHVYVNNVCVMDGTSPKDFSIPGADIAAFRVVGALNSTTINVDDVKIYDKLPTKTENLNLAAACTDGSMYYGTYSNTSAFVVPSDLIVSEVSVIDGKLYVEDYDTNDIVPANTGVLISSDTSGEHTITLTTGGNSLLDTDNMLRATGTGITSSDMSDADANCVFYRLTMHNGTALGFYWGATDGAAFDIAANKAYLAVPTSLAKDGFGFGGDETTGINLNVNENVTNAPMYNMAGQRVGEGYKGLVIVNGKKFINK